MATKRTKARYETVALGILVVACSQRTDLGLLDRVKNRRQIDRSVETWSKNADRPDLRTAALHDILDCARDASASEESRAYCLAALNGLTGKSDEALEQINGLVMPTRVVQLAKIFTEIEDQTSKTR